MNRPELYNKTVGILVDSYFNDTLKHGDCTYCAVGNLVSHRMPFSEKDRYDLTYGKEGWVTVFCTFNAHTSAQYQRIYKSAYNGIAKRQIDSTGYTWEELSKIEYAFETADQGDVKNPDEYMFNGLMAVVDILDEIHENKDQSVTDTSKKRFHKQTV